MKTPIEWLIDKFENEYGFNFGVFEKELIYEATKLETQHIKDAYNEGYRDGEHDCGSVSTSRDKDISQYANAEVYYKNAYKK